MSSSTCSSLVLSRLLVLKWVCWYKISWWDFYWDCTGSLYQYKKNWYFNNIVTDHEQGIYLKLLLFFIAFKSVSFFFSQRSVNISLALHLRISFFSLLVYGKWYSFFHILIICYWHIKNQLNFMYWLWT